MSEATCQYIHCGRHIVVTPGHRPRSYCDDRCKVAAYRLRQEQAERARHLEALHAQFGGYDEKTLQLLDSIMQRGSVELAQRVAWAINAEAGKQVHAATRAATQKVWELQKQVKELEQEIAGLREKQRARVDKMKLKTAGNLQELEQARADLRRLYQTTIAHLEQELATYRQIVDLSDRARLERQLYDIGEQIGYRQFIPADHLLMVGQGEEFWRAFVLAASDEDLASAVVRVKHYAGNLITIDAQVEVQRLRARIRELEKQTSPPDS
ncbi:MAG TPA: hypothetical protein VNG51_25620 [Ktedonobacteraceae bacterium]|nr:hypothetical protein [Ktedonobacteraceae bacterium]